MAAATPAGLPAGADPLLIKIHPTPAHGMRTSPDHPHTLQALRAPIPNFQPNTNPTDCHIPGV